MHVNLISVTDPKAMLFFVMLQNIVFLKQVAILLSRTHNNVFNTLH